MSMPVVVVSSALVKKLRLMLARAVWSKLPPGALGSAVLAGIGTDRRRLDSYSRDLAVNQSTLYAGYPWRFTHFRKTDGSSVNNAGGFWTARVTGFDASTQCEADHELVWLDPLEALSRLRHEAHAWAVAKWLRSKI